MNARRETSSAHAVGVHTAARRAMTLVELIASPVITGVLAAAMMSAMVIAGHALPESKPAEERALAAADALELLASELTFATAITTLTDRDIVFTVADRGHAPPGAETIRYVWSGAVGAPLHRQYNGGPAEAVVDRVGNLVLTPRPALKELTTAPRVLMVVADEVSKTPNDQGRQSLLESWGFSVQLMSDDRAAADIGAVVPNIDVVYLSGDIGNVAGFTLPDVRVGVLIESCSGNAVFALSSDCVSKSDKDLIVLDNQHEILTPYTLGAEVSLTGSSDTLAEATGLAPGIQRLGQSKTGGDSLFALDLGGELVTGSFAKARRVRLPWGTSYAAPFPFSQLTAEGQTILRRSLAWVSATPVLAGVKVSVLPDDPGAAAVETDILILNQPRDLRP